MRLRSRCRLAGGGSRPSLAALGFFSTSQSHNEHKRWRRRPARTHPIQTRQRMMIAFECLHKIFLISHKSFFYSFFAFFCG